MRQANFPSLLMAMPVILKRPFFSALPLIIVLTVSCNQAQKQPAKKPDTGISQTNNKNNRNPFILNKPLLRDELVKRLTRAGELEVSGDDPGEVSSYFDTVNFKFHGPNGYETDYAGLNNYFKSFRAAFDDRSIKRGIIVADGNYIACQTWMEGKFVNEFTQSPAGLLKPNGQRVVFDLINIFRFDDQGRLVEEWVQRDYRGLLDQLGAKGK